MFKSRITQLISGTLLAVVATTTLGGCVSTSGLQKYPADQAWAKAKQASEQSKWAETVAGWGGVEIDPALFGNAEEEAEQAAKSAKTPVQALDEIVDDVSQHLVKTMPAHAKSQGAQWRLALAIGTLIDGTEDKVLGSAMDQIAINLNRNDEFKRRFAIVASTKEESEALLEKISGAHPDDIVDPDSDEVTGAKVFHPDDIYLMSGRTDVLVTEDNRIMTATTIIDITHLKNREKTDSKKFTRTYYFHPGDMAYISSAENQRRADALENDSK